MNYYYNISDIVYDCIDYVETVEDDSAAVICEYEVALEIINYVLKNTPYTLGNCIIEDDGLPVMVDFYPDGIMVSSAYDIRTHKFLGGFCGHILVDTIIAKDYLVDHPDDKIIEFMCGDLGYGDDYAICMHEDNKGFCFCKTTKDGEYTFSYQTNKVLKPDDVYDILKSYGKVFKED